MAPDQKPAAVSFTGGKDCTLALHEVSEQGYEVRLLVSFGPHNVGNRFTAHPLTLVKAQAKALGIPHVDINIQAPYLESYQAAITSLREAHGIEYLVTGDILDVAKGFMERAVQGTGVTLVRPLWQRPRLELLDAMETRGLDMVVTCVNISKIDREAGASLLGLRGQGVLSRMREVAEATGADAAGEHGEFHTAVLDGPFFQQSRVRLVDEEGKEVVPLGQQSPEQHRSFESPDGKYLFLEFKEALLEDKGQSGAVDVEEQQN